MIDVDEFVDKLWKKWTKAIPEERINLKWPSLKGIVQWYVRECDRRGLDPQEAIDLEAQLDPSLRYLESKKILESLLTTPLTDKEADIMYEEFKALQEKQVREKYPELVEEWTGKIVELEREVVRGKKRLPKIKLLERELAEAERKLEEKRVKLPPPPPPLKPPKIPPVKVLPPVPEKCPICGTRLELVKTVPLLVPDPLRLTSEEEYWRAEMKMPLPTVTAKMIDVPPTMKVWTCLENHYFERDAAGRLIQRTSEYLYRKILRETAKLRRLAYPPVAPPVRVPRAIPIGPPKAKILPDFFEWLKEHKGITIYEWAKKSDAERKPILDEFEAYTLNQIKKYFGPQ